MIYDEMEYLLTKNDLDYYFVSEVGFTHKKFANQNKLYEFFGRSSSSTYYEIFNKGLYSNNLIEQVWIFDKDRPVGLCLGVHFENFKPLIHQEKKLGEILGQIQLYVKPEYRKQGIAKTSTQILEKGYLKYDEGFIVMQDDAFKFKDTLEKLVPIPFDYKEHMDTIIKDLRLSKINHIRSQVKASLIP